MPGVAIFRGTGLGEGGGDRRRRECGKRGGEEKEEAGMFGPGLSPAAVGVMGEKEGALTASLE